MITREKRQEEVDRILDGWFGEPLEHSENEDQLRRHLYGPLYSVVEMAFAVGYGDGYEVASAALGERMC